MERNPTDLREHAAQKQQADEEREAKQRERIADFQWLMDHPEGRRFVWRLLETAGVFRSSFDSDALAMAFREGNRNLGVQLMAECHEHALQRYMQMVKEQGR